MTTHYVRFSFAIALTTDEEQEWATRVAAFLKTDPAERNLADPLCAILPDDDHLEYDVEVTQDGPWATPSLWIYAEESGEPFHVWPLVQEYLRRFDPAGAVGFGWADYCDALRVDEFGGGACFITAHDVRWVNTYEWLVGTEAEHRRRSLFPVPSTPRNRSLRRLDDETASTTLEES